MTILHPDFIDINADDLFDHAMKLLKEIGLSDKPDVLFAQAEALRLAAKKMETTAEEMEE